MNEQIEEMAKVIARRSVAFRNPNVAFMTTAHKTAESLYNAGYRKQIEGEWEKRTFIIFDSEKVGYRCSECNTTWDTTTPFCPNCGAKMKGDKYDA